MASLYGGHGVLPNVTRAGHKGECSVPVPTLAFRESKTDKDFDDDGLTPIGKIDIHNMQQSMFAHLKPLDLMQDSTAIERSGAQSPGLGQAMGGLTFAADQDYDACHKPEKPPVSFASLISMAILDSPMQRMTVSDIYQWIRHSYPYFQTAAAGTGWKNSVRHNLSLNKHFAKVSRDEPGYSGKGSYWTILPESVAMIEATIRKQQTNKRLLGNGVPDATEAFSRVAPTFDVTEKPSGRPFSQPQPPLLSTSKRPGHGSGVRRPQGFHYSPALTSSQDGTDSVSRAASALFSLTQTTSTPPRPPANGGSEGELPRMGRRGSGGSGASSLLQPLATSSSAPSAPSRHPSPAQARIRYNPNAHKDVDAGEETGSSYSTGGLTSGRSRSGSGSMAMEGVSAYGGLAMGRSRSGSNSSMMIDSAETDGMQKVYTFSAPPGGSRSRSGSNSLAKADVCGPELNCASTSGSAPNSVERLGSTTGSLAAVVRAIRRKLPLGVRANSDTSGGSMECSDDESTTGAVAALLGLGGL